MDNNINKETDLIPGLKLPDGSITPGERIERTLRFRNVLMANSLPLEGKRVLDIGCAEGLNSLRMASKAREVVGVDFNNEQIKLAKNTRDALKINNVEFIQGDIRERKIFDSIGYFDIIIAWGFLHRIADIFSFFNLISNLGDAISLEWRTPAIPLSSHLSWAYHSTDTKIARTNISDNTDQSEYVENTSGFWEPTPGAIRAIAKREGFTASKVIGYGDNLSNFITNYGYVWTKYLIKYVFQKKKYNPQIPLTRVHMMCANKNSMDSLNISKPKNKIEAIPNWDHALTK